MADPEKVQTKYSSSGFLMKNGKKWSDVATMEAHSSNIYVSFAFESYARLTIEGTRFGYILKDGRAIIGHPGGWISTNGDACLDFTAVTLSPGESPEAPLKNIKKLEEITLCRKFYEQIKDYIPESAKVTINNL